MNNEQWKAITGFEQHYEISNMGRVRSIKNGRQRFLKVAPQRDPKRYPCVTLSKDGVPFLRSVHTLVALHFIGPKPSPVHEVRHLDGDNLNPRVDNLAWGTRKDNAIDRDRHGRTLRGPDHGMYGRGLKGEENGFSKLTEENVRQIRALAQSGTPQRQIAKTFHITQGIVWRAIHRKAWAHVE